MNICKSSNVLYVTLICWFILDNHPSQITYARITHLWITPLDNPNLGLLAVLGAPEPLPMALLGRPLGLLCLSLAQTDFSRNLAKTVVVQCFFCFLGPASFPGPPGSLLGGPRRPLLERFWALLAGSFWDLPGADLDDLDDVCGAT